MNVRKTFTYVRLEPYEGKLSCTVLRRERRGNPPDPANWKQSGKKPWTYAKENGIIPQTFCRWIKRETNSTSGFVEIPPHKKLKLKPELPQEILVEKGDMKIHIPLSVWIEYPGVVMEGLRATP